MCTIDSIKLQVMVFSWFKLIIALYIFGTGIYFASSTDVQQAFGLEYISYGLSLIFLSLLSGGIIFPHKYAVNKHNRFLLAMAFVFDTIVFAELINFGIIIGSYMPPEFSKELQLDCLKNTPEIYTVEECTPYYNSDRTAGMRLLWETYFTDRSNKASFQVLTTFEGGTCCGFFQPFRCIENESKFPKSRLQEGVASELLSQRVSCGAFSDYYPQQSDCTDYKDFATQLIGGCEYDLGVGFCLDVTIKEDSLGCASIVEDYAVELIAPHSIMLLVSSAFSLLFMTYSCCMWWKRKETDLFPEFVTDVKVNRQYKFVKDQFEVAPRKDLLIREGFVPPPQRHELSEGVEFTDMTNIESSPHENTTTAGKGSGGRVGENGESDEKLENDQMVRIKEKKLKNISKQSNKIHPIDKDIEN